MIDLARKLWALKPPRVVVVGDAITDVDVHGRWRSFPAQEAASCPVFVEERRAQRPGGAGAVAAMVRGLLADTAEFSAGLHVKRRYFVGGQQIFRVDDEASPAILNARLIAEEIPYVDAVLIADYGKGVCTPAVLRAAIDGAKARDIPCIVDPARGADATRYAGATWIKCNAAEFAALKARPEPLPPRVIVTLGADGIRPMRTDSEQYATTYPTRPRNVVDVTGAGDMVLAALGVAIAGGLSWAEACTIAVAASGCKVERQGAVPVSRAEVVVDLLHDIKIVPPDLLPAIRDVARAQGQRVAFTNGCFDVLHAGHVHCLTEARAQGDVLVVGLNSDASVRRLKGPRRPVNTAADRAAVLAGLACVDYVVEFDADDPAELVRTLRPDVMVKGADYANRHIAGAEHAGRVHLVPLRDGRSSTATIDALHS